MKEQFQSLQQKRAARAAKEYANLCFERIEGQLKWKSYDAKYVTAHNQEENRCSRINQKQST